MNPGHQPERFVEFTELADGSGFTIPDCPTVFLFDRFGGWSDEYGNYYNEHGDPDDPPSSSDSHSHSDTPSDHSERSSNSDPFEAEFGPPGQGSDDDADEEDEATVAQNLLNLQHYPAEQLLRVYIRNLPFKTRKEELLKAYSAHAEGILNAIVDTDETGCGIGTGYFIVRPDTAQHLVHLEGRRLLERPLSFYIEDYENFLVFPVTENELGQQPPSPPRKKYAPKYPEQPEPPKEEPKWNWYRFEKKIFPKKIDFQGWMSDHGFNADQDFRNIEKIENDPEKRFAKVEMKESAFSAMNGLAFGDQAVEFTPL